MSVFAHPVIVWTHLYNTDQRHIVTLMVIEVFRCILLRVSGKFVIIHLAFMLPMDTEDVSLPHKRISYGFTVGDLALG